MARRQNQRKRRNSVAASEARSLTDFLQWLDDVLETLRILNKNYRPWPKGATRFQYWDSLICRTAWINLRDKRDTPDHDRARALSTDPQSSTMKISLVDHDSPRHRVPRSWLEQFEESYRKDYEAGDLDAIFEFARDNREVFRSQWAVGILTDWRLAGTPEAKRCCDRFMRAYWSE